ncbi:MAG TPA: hypothetical protein PLT66_08580, partial [Bacillota bacterium]|nr:hypothetical protein [Bacillota bacterium]
DTSNESLWGTSVEGIFFKKRSAVSKVTGILGGSTLTNYNSAIGSFKDLVFYGLYCGISGDAEPDGVGIFDCYFENIFMSDCTYGFHLYGSGNTIIHPRVSTCKAGLVLDYLNGESFDGVHVIGGIFAANTIDILVPSKNGTRPCDFVGTWFETAAQGILSITNANTRVMNMTFRDCMLNSSADGKNYFLFDASNAVGVVTLDSCTVVTYAGIVEPKSSAGKLAITNLQVYDSTTYVINDSDQGSASFTGDGTKTVFTVVHSVGKTPSFVNVTPSSAAAAEGTYYVTADDKRVTVTFTKAPAKGEIVSFYWQAQK